jgi:hypothetical protein
VAFLLNFVPILGPVLGVVIFILAGLLTMDTLWLALLPAGLYRGLTPYGSSRHSGESKCCALCAQFHYHCSRVRATK